MTEAAHPPILDPFPAIPFVPINLPMSASPKAVFLSYASQDAEDAQRICEALRAAGIEVWFDQSELRGGDAWDASIRRQVRECALFVPVVSKSTEARSEGYFRLEWKLAVDRSHLMADDQRFLLPVVVDGTVEASARVPDRFRERQWSRLSDEGSMRAFAQRVSLLLSGEDASPPPAPAEEGGSFRLRHALDRRPALRQSQRRRRGRVLSPTAWRTNS